MSKLKINFTRIGGCALDRNLHRPSARGWMLQSKAEPIFVFVCIQTLSVLCVDVVVVRMKGNKCLGFFKLRHY